MVEIEELSLEGLEPEVIEKAIGCAYYKFPAVTVSDRTIYFNKAAAKCGLVPNFIRWMTTTDYVIGLPAQKIANDAFSARHQNHMAGMAAHFPMNLREEKRIQTGTYKLLKCKDGFAFKRYERLEEK